MAVLGVGGRLVLKREAPDVCIINGDSINADQDQITTICPGYWSGDHISTDCLPVNEGTFPPNPAGYATYYGSKWFLGPNRTHIISNRDIFYKNDREDYPDGQFGDDAQFYCREGDVSDGKEIPPCTPGDYWIHIDALGYVSFYTSRCDALAGCPEDRVNLEAVGGNISVAPYGSVEYVNAVWECINAMGEYRFSDGQDTVTLVSICEDPPLYENPKAGFPEYDNADIQPRGATQGKGAPFWQVLCEIREWTLELSAPAVDTTSVAEKFGNAVKSLVTGGGSTEFLIDRLCLEDNQDNGLVLMQLLLMTEKGCKASAQFWMMTGTNACNQKCEREDRIDGGLYYEADILVTDTAVNVRPTEIVAGTARFVTTGDIRLLTSPY